MRSIETMLDRFCRKHPRFGIPNLMTIVALGTALVYLLNQFGRGVSLSAALALFPSLVLEGEIWRLVTFVFVPMSGGVLLLLELYFYWFIGSALEREWGTAKFSLFYLSGVVLNILFGFLALATGDKAVLVTMRYVNLSLFFAFATLYPNLQVLLFFIIPIKVKWLAWVDAALFAWSVLSSLLALDLAGAILPLVAILNYFLFFASDLRNTLGYARRRVQHQTSRQTINFKKATRQAQQQKGYIHKCAVCGKTDTDYPDMEFRYCSKCNGYYCYCKDHINNHVHIE
ncbi:MULTISPECIES: rhomboid family intramembrane serine protease [unclassified Flavonifractor]|uniref:rhomboid family intramembrane serine protease n=1 Tax=Flavonifractor sp. An92 TaxID=1965666 RepID=UPI001FA90654|nr:MULTISPECIES: rhomboid family intramembrane serine protease [unclassified Flavonifractor]